MGVAIFYDIENLIGGHNLKYLSELSLKSLYKEFKKIGIDRVAIQKAYADWSNPRIQTLKWDIAELGIEPVQMYGFIKSGQKNASDIQLVIDVVDTLFTKDFIDIFVIVSGDGDFLPLAKKIKEHGKSVIGCSYKTTANSIFVKVCNNFLYIDNSLKKEQLMAIEKITIDENKLKYIQSDPILKEVLPNFQQIEEYNLPLVIEKIEKLFKGFADNENANRLLQGDGLNISVFKSALNYIFLDFDQRKLGFSRLTDFLRYSLNGSGYYLALKEPSEYRIFQDGFENRFFRRVEYISERPKFHTMENYSYILRRKQPMIFAPENRCNFKKVLDFLSENSSRFENIKYQDVLLTLFKALEIESRELEKLISLLVNLNILTGDNPELNLKEQSFSYTQLSSREVEDRVKAVIKKKIELSLNEKDSINSDILEKIYREFDTSKCDNEDNNSNKDSNV